MSPLGSEVPPCWRGKQTEWVKKRDSEVESIVKCKSRWAGAPECSQKTVFPYLRLHIQLWPSAGCLPFTHIYSPGLSVLLLRLTLTDDLTVSLALWLLAGTCWRRQWLNMGGQKENEDVELTPNVFLPWIDLPRQMSLPRIWCTQGHSSSQSALSYSCCQQVLLVSRSSPTSPFHYPPSPCLCPAKPQQATCSHMFLGAFSQCIM